MLLWSLKVTVQAQDKNYGGACVDKRLSDLMRFTLQLCK